MLEIFNKNDLKNIVLLHYFILSYIKNPISNEPLYLFFIKKIANFLFICNHSFDPETIGDNELDLVLYDEWEDKFCIYDIKTSTRGWGDWAKKDEAKQS